MKTFKEYIKEKFVSGFYYHGSNNDSITEFIIDEDSDKFSLLGKGIYFYKNEKSAEQYGKYIYKVKIDKSFKILDEKYEITDSNIEGIITNLKRKGAKIETIQKVSGFYNITWWFTEAPSFFNIDRKYIIEVVPMFFSVMHSFDGVSLLYPNGGEVVCIWNKNKFPKPLDVKIIE